METTYNFDLKEIVKSFCNGWRVHFKEALTDTTQLHKLKSKVITAGLFTIVLSTMFFILAIFQYAYLDLKSGNATSLILSNQTTIENFNDPQENLGNSTTNGHGNHQKPRMGFDAFCGLLLYAHILFSSVLLIYGTLKECKSLVTPWMLFAFIGTQGLLLYYFLIISEVESVGLVICGRIFIVCLYTLNTLLLFKVIDLCRFLTERDKRKRATYEESRPNDLPGETENEESRPNNLPGETEH